MSSPPEGTGLGALVALGVPVDRLAEFMLHTAEKAGFGIFVSRGAGTELRHVWVNDAGAALMGWPREELLSRPITDFISREELSRLAEASTSSSFVRATCINASGNEFPIDIAWVSFSEGTERYSVTFITDSSQQHAAETARTREQARFRRLIEGAPDGVVISREGTIVFANRAAAAMLGELEADALVGKQFAQFLSPEDLQRMRKRIQLEASSTKPLGPAEYRARRSDGGTTVAEITSLLIEFEGAPAIIGFARDVTERVEVQEQLARAERLASIGTLAAGVAHEINNPLTFMTLGTSLLSSRIRHSSATAAEQEAMLATLGDVQRGVERVASIVRELSAFSRSARPTIGRFDLPRTLEAARHIVAHRTRHAATIELSVPELPSAYGDASQVEQVFVNLFINAAQAIESSGVTGTIEVSGRVDGDMIVVDVKDDGPGIDPAHIDRIFDPFFTTKPVGVGTGLGLSVCHRIISQLGGRIRVESTPKSTTFSVSVPRASAPEATAPSASPSPSPSQSRRVLVVDDEPVVARAIAAALKFTGHEVTTAASGEEALGILRADNAFDVVLCDLAMPRMSGIDLHTIIQREAPDVARRFVLMTGGPKSERAQTIVSKWTGRRLYKPFSPNDLEALLASDREEPSS